MAEEVKKKTPTKPRKPRAPKAQPTAVAPKNVENIEKEIIPVEPVLSEDIVDEPGDVEVFTPAEPEKEIVSVEEQLPEEKPEETSPAEPEEQPEVLETKLPEGTPTFQEFQESLEKSPVELKKLNPNLPNNKSKWVAQIPYGKSSAHVLFKGSYVRALQAAQNYNISRGLGPHVKKN